MARSARRQPSAIAILKALPTSEATYVFAGIRGARHRRGVLEGLPIADVRPHDFRRTAASMLAASGISRLTISKLLNHVETGVTAVYDRHSYDAEKRLALETWERRLHAILSEKATANVVAFTK